MFSDRRVGTVTAGQPILAVEEIEGYIPFRSRSLHSKDHMLDSQLGGRVYSAPSLVL